MKPAIARYYWKHITEVHRVLDLGCATGDLGRYRPAGTEVYGLEINPQLVLQAKRHETASVWNLDCSKPLPFENDFFDAVVAKDILEHIQKPWLLLAEVRRVLRAGGVVLASVICERSRRIWTDYTHVRGFTMASAGQLFTDAGLEVLDIWRMGGVPLTSRYNLIWLVPYLLRFPLFDWIWTSSYEIKARRPG